MTIDVTEYDEVISKIVEFHKLLGVQESDGNTMRGNMMHLTRFMNPLLTQESKEEIVINLCNIAIITIAIIYNSDGYDKDIEIALKTPWGCETSLGDIYRRNAMLVYDMYEFINSKSHISYIGDNSYDTLSLIRRYYDDKLSDRSLIDDIKAVHESNLTKLIDKDRIAVNRAFHEDIELTTVRLDDDVYALYDVNGSNELLKPINFIEPKLRGLK